MSSSRAHLPTGRHRAPNGLAARIRAFFDANPSEYATRKDLAVKLGATERQVTCAMWRLSARGEFESVRVYRRAPEATE